MIIRLIATPDAAEIAAEEAAANPSVIRDIHDDVLRDLMATPHAVEHSRIAEHVDTEHPRRRMCV